MPNTLIDFARLAIEQSNGVAAPELREQLDGIAAIASKLFAAPVAFISLIAETSQPVIGRSGWQADFFQHGEVFGSLVADGTDGVLVHDARKDPRFANHPMVTRAPQLRFVASVPLLGSDGTAIGALCVLDTLPREPSYAPLLDHLRILAKATIASLEQWSVAQTQVQGVNRRFETLADALPQLVWSTRPDGQGDYFSQQWCRFTGAPAKASYGTGWLDFVHADDVATARDAWQHAVATGQPYAAEFRVRSADGTYRWMLTRGLPVTDAFGAITRWVGTCTDIDERVRTGDLMEFMSRELSHRIKNLFSVVQGLISMALRKHAGMTEVSQSLQLRMVALGRAHDLVRPRIADGAILRSHTTLTELIKILTLPYSQDDPGRLEIVGDDAVVNDQAATPLALFFHEMAINSARFGALSVVQGRLLITITLRDDVTVVWKEIGGPLLTNPPVPAFGLGLTKLSIERQLGGTLTMDWQEDGLRAIARIPLGQLTAE